MLGDEITLVKLSFKNTKLALDSLSIYRQLLDDKVLSKLYSLSTYMNGAKVDLSNFFNMYTDFFYTLSYNSNGSLKDYIIDKIIFDENPYSKAAAGKVSPEQLNSLQYAASKDLERLQMVSNITSALIKDYVKKQLSNSDSELNFIEDLPEWICRDEYYDEHSNYSNDVKSIIEAFYKSSNWAECLEMLGDFHKKQGCGIFARYRAFIWKPSIAKEGLISISDPDPVTLYDLIGYEVEREKAIENTVQFLKGFSANNVLFYGDRGTGKSSTVKAILNEYYRQGLRMIELSKQYLSDLPLIIRILKSRPEKFIIFIDDLSFQDNDENYNALKAVIEGGLENRPYNVLIYATSNRRHLVKEYFQDRDGFQGSNNDEIYTSDNMEEKLSLSDRFGISITFSSPNKIKYLQIVDNIAEKRNLKISKEKLHSEAVKWEMWYNGRSPRTAKQFIDWIEGQEALKDL